MAEKLTAKTLRTLPGPEGNRPQVIHYDGDLPGFGLRITKAGARSLVLNYRANGVERRMTIGSIPTGATVEETDRVIAQGRREAARLKSGAKYDGADPMSVRHADRAKATVAGLAERYIEQHLPKKRPSSQAEDRLIISGIILPALQSKRVSDVQFSDVDGLHRKITKSGSPIRANRVVSLLSKMFNLSISWGWRVTNPAKGVQRNPEERRQRYLSADELKRIGNVLAKHPRKSANAIRLLLLTGARRGEVLGATWDQFDLVTGVWVKPSSHTKQKKEHRVPLSGPARKLLSEMHEAAVTSAKDAKVDVSPFLFPGKEDGEAQKALKHIWQSVCKRAKVSGVRIHDLRHTYASVLASAGQSLPVIGALLGHTSPNTTARYAHLFDDPLRAATERAGSIMSGDVGRKATGKSANVVPIRPGRR